ncbi:unnamed protein product [Parnassius apollo]|uniref:(apollo) hypothetical protein n=1 Tax=Parnassius apollo TaxID=110799 RepID=A0A8S3XFQ8_PARAO|nr:unnamed protein product [Parnassius apollo]
MVEVDPKLFVTCRLCLDHMGVYQIVPNVQQQIKFCYDIEVDPFDGLPQLICKTCECILSKYIALKTTYIDKQKTLREKLERNVATSLGTEIQPEQETVSSTQQLASEVKDRKGRKEITFYSASSDKSDTDTSIKLKNKRIKSYKRIKKPPRDKWENNYNKRFICRFCNKSYKSRSGMIRHINTHSSLLFKYQTCINSHCSVKLNKVDVKPNICDSERIVVHNWNKLIKSEDRFFYTLFKPKQQLVSKDSQNLEVLKGEESLSSAESSDNEPIFKVKKKRRRLLSRSSNETVVLEKNNIKDSAKRDVEIPSEQVIAPVSSSLEQNDAECINIDDSSDTASCKSSNTEKNETNMDLLLSIRDGDYKTIQNIISVCYKKFLIRLESAKGHESTEIPCNIIQKPVRKIDSSIKHKVLSIGRKVINNAGFNCTGLLRYLEHQNLDIVWIPSLLTHSSHVRIMMKLKNCEENNASDYGWEILKNVELNNDSERSSAGTVNDKLTTEILNPSTDKATMNIRANNSGLITESQLNTTEVLPDQIISTDQKITDERDCLLKKLLNVNHVPLPKQILNASPVANPKQLPKKSNTNENQNKFLNQKQNLIITAPGDESVLVDRVEDSNEHLLMPVITSTVSLAIGTSGVTEEQKSNDENVDLISPTVSNCQMPEECRGKKNGVSKNESDTVNCEDQQDSIKNTPRIKVKPVSELMSDKALNNMHKQQAEQSSNIINPNQKSGITHQNRENVVYMGDIAAPQLSISNNQDLQNSVQYTTSGAAGESTSASAESNNGEYVLMDSVDLPFTRTDSPFRYFKNLLHVHNITLLDGNETLSSDFVCLLKFKLAFQRESNAPPVVLCLALFNSKRKFCLKLNDAEKKVVDISKLSANWQWEILKATSLGTEIQPAQETVRSSASEVKDRKGRKKITFCSTSLDKSDTDTSIKLKNKRIKSYKRIKKPPPDKWENNYNKRFICRFCNKSYKTESGMIRHINTHSSLLLKYQTCINSHCSVKLNKVDVKPNICDSERIVVHNWNKLIKSEDRFFYTLFKPKQQLVSKDSQNLTLEVLKGEESLSSAESSDNEPIFKVKKKRRRLLSRSSNETVVLEKNKDSAKVNVELPSKEIIAPLSSLEQNNAECFNIDHSSDITSYNIINPAKNEKNLEFLISLWDGDYKTIQNIISVCYKKYLITLESSEIPCNIIQKPAHKIDPSIEQKVLSIGRKVITNSDFNCTGLLRYLEYLNLEIVWIPALLTHSSHVRIMMKLKNCEENNASDLGWEVLQKVQLNNDFERNGSGTVNDQLTSENLNQSTDKAITNIKANENELIAKSLLNTTEVLTDQTNNTDSITDDKGFLLKKRLNVKYVPFPKQLLNASPVANPKQLPKNSNTNENQNKILNQKQNLIITAPGYECVLVDRVEDSNEHLLMPVITSTVSLAIGTSGVTEEQKSNDENALLSPTVSNCKMPEECRGKKIGVNKTDGDTANCEDQQDYIKNIPRIKVKPVSELMSDIALNNMHKQQAKQSSNIINQNQKNSMSYQNTENVVYMSDIVTPQLINSSNQDVKTSVQYTTSAATAEESTSSFAESNNRKYVLMDSVDLSYIGTDSPFQYFKYLLHIHNITLLDANEKMSFDFVCLLEFNLVFRQASHVPVLLSLALYNSERKFCLKIIDGNEKEIDISKVSKNWQSEILKGYRNEITRLMQNAENVRQEVNEVFLCLSKSIKFQKLS